MSAGGRIPGSLDDALKTGANAYKLIEQSQARSTYGRNILRGVLAPDILNAAFFSGGNIEIIQNAIRYAVFVATKGASNIAPQDETNLVVIMRATFLLHAATKSVDPTQHIAFVNSKVVEAALPLILSALRQHQGYLSDIYSPLKVMDRSLNVNSCGTKSLNTMPRV
jgi:transcriptional regulator with PAS, ATPase and Fis domain